MTPRGHAVLAVEAAVCSKALRLLGSPRSGLGAPELQFLCPGTKTGTFCGPCLSPALLTESHSTVFSLVHTEAQPSPTGPEQAHL